MNLMIEIRSQEINSHLIKNQTTVFVKTEFYGFFSNKINIELLVLKLPKFCYYQHNPADLGL